MSFIKKGPPYSFPKGLEVIPLENSKFRIELSAGFVQTGVDFTLEELQRIHEHLTNVMQMTRLTGYNYAPTKQNVDINDEESRA